MIDKQRLEEKCSTWNIALTGTQLDQLDAFAHILPPDLRRAGRVRGASCSAVAQLRIALAGKQQK